MKEELKPFQKESILKQKRFLLEGGSSYNACEQGLGKSAMTVKLLNELNAKKVLIICPASVRCVWEDEVTKWSEKKYSVETMTTGQRKWDFSKDIIVTSYSLAIAREDRKARKKDRVYRYDKDFLGPWDVLVLDEAHYLKSLSAERTRYILGTLWPRAKYHIALSGTPVTRNVVDLFPIANRMAPDLFPIFNNFAAEYSYVRHTLWRREYHGIKNAEKLKELIRSRFFVRYTKEEVAPELPEKIFQKILLPESFRVKPPATDKEKLEESIQAFRKSLEKGETEPPKIMPALSKLKRLQGIEKIGPVTDFVKDLLDTEQPTILFGYHTEVLDKLKMELKRYHPAIITGSTPMKDRKEAVDWFQSGETNLFIGQMIAAGTGITLNRAQNVVFAEFDWSPAVISQAIDRAHRIGTRYPVNVYYFVVKNSVDQQLIESVMSKVKSFNRFVEN